MTLPNGYLRCESRRARSGLFLGLWKYSLAFVIVASAALDTLWLVPAQERATRAAEISAYREALWYRCRTAVHARHRADAPRIAPAPVVKDPHHGRRVSPTAPLAPVNAATISDEGMFGSRDTY